MGAALTGSNPVHDVVILRFPLVILNDLSYNLAPVEAQVLLQASVHILERMLLFLLTTGATSICAD